jgi:uncharacterized protein
MAAGTPSGRETHTPRRSRRRFGEDGRPLSTAGHAFLVAVLALVFGSVLGAPGMHKAAFNQQPGATRDIALAITGPLAGLSHALLLDRPRRLVQDAIGRGDDDTIDVAIVVPPVTQATPSPKPQGGKPSTPAVQPARAPAKIAFTPKRRLRVWVAGDSLVITPGYSIVRAVGSSPVMQSVGGVDGHVGTGLERPDVFNWFEEIRTKMKKLKPNVVVLNFGGNDDHGYMTGLPAGTSIDGFDTPSWRREYGRRVGGVMDTISRAGGVAIWIGLPITRSPAQTQRFDVINAVVVQEARKRSGKAFYLDTYGMFASDSGGFAEYLPDASGGTVKVRTGDGVHFDIAGGDMIARAVLKQLNETFDLTSWRRHASSGTG